MPQLTKVDIKDVRKEFPKSEYPCLDYCKKHNLTGRLEVWNYERLVPEADWIVKDAEDYVKNPVKTKKQRIRCRPLVLG